MTEGEQQIMDEQQNKGSRLWNKGFGAIDAIQLAVAVAAIAVVVVLGLLGRDTVVCLTAAILGGNLLLAVSTWRYTRETKRMADEAEKQRESSKQALYIMQQESAATARLADATVAAVDVWRELAKHEGRSVSLREAEHRAKRRVWLTLTPIGARLSENSATTTVVLSNAGPAPATVTGASSSHDGRFGVQFDRDSGFPTLTPGSWVEGRIVTDPTNAAEVKDDDPRVMVTYTDGTGGEQRQEWRVIFSERGDVEKLDMVAAEIVSAPEGSGVL
jgi:hypothetical protein